MFSITDKEQIASLLKASEAFSNPRFTLSGTLKKNIDALVLSDIWPREVPQSLIINTPEQARLRARSIAHFYGLQHFKGQKFLDFGCGKGDCVAEAAGMEVKAFGFDTKEQWVSDQWNCTTDIQNINAHGPYDLIALYDVIDHTESHEKALEALRRIAVVSTPETVIRVRCHPWTSRHGGHLYESINRAYAHILLSEEALAELPGTTDNDVRKIKTPMNEYRTLFNKAGFKIEKCNKATTPLEPLFRCPQLVELFKVRLGKDKKWQSEILPVCFIDYTLQKK